ncbi:MAG: DNA methyltransferase [Myxococcota bacterium]
MTACNSTAWHSPRGDISLYQGRWEDRLSVLPESYQLITDPPYSKRTAEGQRSSGHKTSSAPGYDKTQSKIDYGYITEEDAHALVTMHVDNLKRWIIVFGDHQSVRWIQEACTEHGLYDFPPVAWAKTDAAPRFMADGPPPWLERIAVARTRNKLSREEKRHRQGYYLGASRHKDQVVIGGKPLWLMQAVIRDYSEAGDTIVDPYAGGASTLLAAAIEGRKAIGFERSSSTFAKAVARLERGFTPVLPGLEASHG